MESDEIALLGKEVADVQTGRHERSTSRCTCKGEAVPSAVEQEAVARERFLEQLRRRGNTERESWVEGS